MQVLFVLIKQLQSEIYPVLQYNNEGQFLKIFYSFGIAAILPYRV